MKYKKLKVSSNKEFEKNMSDFGAKMAEFGSRMANIATNNSNNEFDIFKNFNFSFQNGTSVITKDKKTIITTSDGDEIVLKNHEIFFNGKKMKVDDETPKNDNQSSLDDFEKKLKKYEWWLFFIMLMIGIIWLTLLFQI